MTLRPVGAVILALALAYTLLNAAKPLNIDDPFIYRVAQQITRAPLDPYGFDIFWFQWPQPVHEELTPPVVPYWWSVALLAFGERPFLWKLWLFPFALLFTAATYVLLRRFARGVELPLCFMTVLSPAYLPSFNLMQDVPAEALGLCALALYLRAADRDAIGTALAAGLVAGLATQTKYTMLTIPAAMLLDAILRRKLRPAAVAVAAALAVFGAWEALMTARYGQGMFVGQMKFELFWQARREMILPLLQMLGATLPALALVGLAAQGVPGRLVVAAGALVVAGFGLLLGYPVETQLFPLLGLLVSGTLVWVVIDLLRPPGAGGAWRTFLEERRDAAFLVLWLCGEILGYFVTAPFPAVRRVLGIVVVATLIVGHRAALARARAAWTWGPAALAALLGLGFFAVDWCEARAQQLAPVRALEAIRRTDPHPTVWFLGHWGFQYYAEKNGMRPLIPDYSLLRTGDWLVVPNRVDQPQVAMMPDEAEKVAQLSLGGFPSLWMSKGFYGGGLPLEHREGPRIETTIYRVLRDSVPRTLWSLARLFDWARRAGGQSAAWAVPALARGLDHPDPAAREETANVLGELGSRAAAAVPALVQALSDTDAGVRGRAAVALGRIGPPAAAAAAGPLRHALADPDAAVRAAAAEALERLRL